MAKKPKRETVTYQLRNNRKVVYIGTTTDPERREQEHRAEGKRFTKLAVTSRRMTEDGAKAKRIEQLEAYRRSHDGKNPKYNKD
jgi:predicted GIY-YIG superfamily endonuclease